MAVSEASILTYTVTLTALCKQLRKQVDRLENEGSPFDTKIPDNVVR